MWLETGTPQNEPNGMGRDVSLLSQTPEGRKAQNPRPNRAVKRTELPSANLVRQSRKK